MLRESASRDQGRQTSNKRDSSRHDGGRRVPASHGPLSTVVYRSRAVRPLSPAELHDLTRVAQARNSREAVTGLMLYDNERFFQWLEGPAQSVSSVMDSIVADHRHTDVEILDNRPTETRMFADWSMKLATPGPVMTSWRKDVIEPPREIVEALRAQPKAAPALLVRLVPETTRESVPGSVQGNGHSVGAFEGDPGAHLMLNQKTAAILRNVFLSAVLPQLNLVNDSFTAEQLSAASPRVVELAELLVAPDQKAASELIEELTRTGARIGQLAASLFEPTARSLGDLWTEDACSEFDVTLALCRLQTAIRLLDAAGPQRLPSRLAHPVVLIAPEPGELHRLGAALDGTVLRNSGWAPHCEYPTDDKSLHDTLSSTWFDVLDLSLSAAFRRDHVLAQLTKTIAEARLSSRNPGLVIVVGGRVFAEEKTAGAAVGADRANTTAMNVNRSILNTMATTPSVLPEVS